MKLKIIVTTDAGLALAVSEVTIDFRDQRWAEGYGSSIDTYILIDIEQSHYPMFLSKDGTINSADQVLSNQTINIWDFWQKGAPAVENFKVPITLFNKIDNTETSFGYLIVDTEPLLSGDEGYFKYNTSQSVENGTLEHFVDATRNYSFKWSNTSNLTVNQNIYDPVESFITDRVKDFRSITRYFRPVYPLTIKNSLDELGGISVDNVYFKDPTTTNNYEQKSATGSGFLKDNAFNDLHIDLPPLTNQKYGVKAKSIIDYNGYQFQYSSGDFNTAGTDFLITAPTTKVAHYKGIQLSNTSFSDSKSGQRGFLKDNFNGYLHNVYESMNKIWYERSTDNGEHWQLMNDGLPINPVGNAKSPSICENQSHDFLYIVYQCDTFPYDGLVVTQFKLGPNFVIPDWTQPICTMSDYIYSNDYQSVISSMGNSGIVVCNPPSTSTAGLRAFQFYTDDTNNYNYSGCTEFSIPSSQNSSNPSLAAGCSRTHLVFEEAKLSIKYYAWGGGVTCSSTLSAQSGTTYNLKPVISLLECGSPVISWIGATTGYYPTRLNTRIGTFANNVMTWGSINSVLGLIRSASNASNSISPQRTLITWTDMYGSKWQKRDGTTYSNPASLSHNGSWTQAATNGNFILPKALVFNNTSTPYYFITSTTDFTGGNSQEGSISNNGIGNNYLGKITENDTILTFGRSGVASINDIEFVFEIGDIIVGDSIIKFIQITDTLAYTSTNELNQHTRTNNFTLNPETNFYFSNIYYVVQKSSPDTALTTTDAVNFKAELVNAATNQIIGTFDNISYNKTNLEKYTSMDYEVDCSGITAGEYYLRLVTDVNGNASYTLANIFNDNTTLAKKNFNKVNFMGSEIPITYELSNNFPNPFNPSTTIRYQIPQDGIVTLKIYDILGSEVATLVNEEKVAGKYEVNFNASSLASGVYIYKIQAGSFINSKKMILLK